MADLLAELQSYRAAEAQQAAPSLRLDPQGQAGGLEAELAQARAAEQAEFEGTTPSGPDIRDYGSLLLEGGGAMLAPSVAVARGLPLAARVGRYGLGALSAEGGAELGRQLGSALGLRERGPVSEELGRSATSLAIGTALPTALDVGATGVQKLAKALVTPAKLAREQGATARQLNPARGQPVTTSIKKLLDTSSYYRSKIAGAANPEKAFANTTTRLKSIGKRIGDFYKKHQKLSTTPDDIRTHPNYQELLDSATNPALPDSARDLTQRVLGDFDSALTKKDMSLDDLWELRQYLDTRFNQDLAKLPEAQSMYRSLRVAVKDKMDDMISKTAGKADLGDILQLNDEYHNLSEVKDILGQAVGREAGKASFKLGLKELLLGGAIGGSLGGGTGVGLGALAYPMARSLAQSPETRALTMRAAELAPRVQQLAPATTRAGALARALGGE